MIWDDWDKCCFGSVLVLYPKYFRSSIVGKEVLPPPDLERIFGLTGGR